MRGDEDRLARDGEVAQGGRRDREGEAEHERRGLPASASEPPGDRQGGREAQAPEERVRAVEGEEPERGPREDPVAPPAGRSARDTAKRPSATRNGSSAAWSRIASWKTTGPVSARSAAATSAAGRPSQGRAAAWSSPTAAVPRRTCRTLAATSEPPESARAGRGSRRTVGRGRRARPRWRRAGAGRRRPPAARRRRTRRCRAARLAAAAGDRGAATRPRPGRRGPRRGRRASPAVTPGVAASSASGAAGGFRASLANPGPPPEVPGGRCLARRGAGVAEQGRLLICCRGLKPLPGVRIPPSPPAAVPRAPS